MRSGWGRAALAGMAALAAATGAVAQSWSAGATVLASPTQMQSSWRRCVVLSGPEGWNATYQLECVDEFMGTAGKLIPSVDKAYVPGKWIKANDPSFRPDMQVPGARSAQSARFAASAAPPPTPRASGPAIVGLKLGEYACYGSGSSVLAGLGFRVLPGGRYTDLDRKSSGTYAVSGGGVSFRGGHLGGRSGRDLRNGRFTVGAMAVCEPWG